MHIPREEATQNQLGRAELEPRRDTTHGAQQAWTKPEVSFAYVVKPPNRVWQKKEVGGQMVRSWHGRDLVVEETNLHWLKKCMTTKVKDPT